MEHPNYPAFAKLGLKWGAVPSITSEYSSLCTARDGRVCFPIRCSLLRRPGSSTVRGCLGCSMHPIVLSRSAVSFYCSSCTSRSSYMQRFVFVSTICPMPPQAEVYPLPVFAAHVLLSLVFADFTMNLGGINYTACPFNGWFMNTEVTLCSSSLCTLTAAGAITRGN